MPPRAPAAGRIGPPFTRQCTKPLDRGEYGTARSSPVKRSPPCSERSCASSVRRPNGGVETCKIKAHSDIPVVSFGIGAKGFDVVRTCHFAGRGRARSRGELAAPSNAKPRPGANRERGGRRKRPGGARRAEIPDPSAAVQRVVVFARGSPYLAIAADPVRPPRSAETPSSSRGSRGAPIAARHSTSSYAGKWVMGFEKAAVSSAV